MFLRLEGKASSLQCLILVGKCEPGSVTDLGDLHHHVSKVSPRPASSLYIALSVVRTETF